MDRAIQLYLSDQELRPPGWDYLPLPEQADVVSSAPDIEINVAAETLRPLAGLAEVEGVPLNDLAAHLVMFSWAQSRPQAIRQEEDPQDTAGGPPSGRPPRLGSLNRHPFC
jgi:hypothetical protein